MNRHEKACITGIADDPGYEREGDCSEKDRWQEKKNSRELRKKQNGKTPEIYSPAEDNRCKGCALFSGRSFAADNAEPVCRRIKKRSGGEVSERSAAQRNDLLESAFSGEKTAGSYISEIEDNAAQRYFSKPEEKLRAKQRKADRQRSCISAPQKIFCIVSKLPELHKMHLTVFFLYYEAAAEKLFRKGVVLCLGKLFIGDDTENLECLRIEPHRGRDDDLKALAWRRSELLGVVFRQTEARHHI